MNCIEMDTKRAFCSEDKRFHVPMVVHADCPKCKKENHYDYKKDYYFAFPAINDFLNEEHFMCKHCEHEFSLSFRLNLQVTLGE